MSIPKEPRQLMINLMYIVLTALLALNVSAEVMQALFAMDKSLGDSSKLVEDSNEKIAAAIHQQADAYTQYEPFKAKVEAVQQTANSFFDFVNELRGEIIEAAGGLDKDGLPKVKDNKDISTRILLNKGRATELKNQILTTREKLLSQIEDEGKREAIAENIPLKINPIPESSEKKDWEQFTFQQMPVAAVLPLLSKFQNDAKLTETSILNHFFGEMNMDVVRPDKFYPVIAADKSYVIRGEQYKGEIFLAAYSSTADNLSISVDGRPLNVEDGKAIFATNPGSIGTRKHNMSIELTNPITGEVETFDRSFTYEVGERSVAIALDKMNVLYVGVENPISMSAAGIPTGDIRVNSKGVNLRADGGGKYTAIPDKIGGASITISGGGLDPTTFDYRVKKIPDPTMYLGRHKSGRINLAEFQAQRGIVPILEGFDFQAKCKVQTFEATRVRNGDAATVENSTGTFNSRFTQLKDNAKRKDIFYFEKIKVRCPGDEYGRTMPGMFFTIK